MNENHSNAESVKTVADLAGSTTKVFEDNNMKKDNFNSGNAGEICTTSMTAVGTGTEEKPEPLSVHPYGNCNLEYWDKKPLVPEVIYHMNKMVGLPVARIKENRDPEKRYKHWADTFQTTGMTTPALYTKSRIVKEAGFTPVLWDESTQSWIEVPEDKLDCFCMIDGHGRGYYYMQDLMRAEKESQYKPLDFIFCIKEYDDAKVFRDELISINNAQQKTTKSQLVIMTRNSVNDPHFKAYLEDIQNKYVAKAAAIKNYGRELSVGDFDDLYNGKSVRCSNQMIENMSKCYSCYAKVFTDPKELKVLHGVPLAKFTHLQLSTASNMDSMSKLIVDRFQHIEKVDSDRIVSAKKDGNKSKETVLLDILESIMGDKKDE